MPSVDDRSDLAPRAEPGALRAFGLAMLVHLLLLIALTWGVSWKSKDQSLSFEAELWSALPQEAAPPLQAPPTPPEPVAPPAPPRTPAASATAQGRGRTRCRHCHRAREKAPGRREKESPSLD